MDLTNSTTAQNLSDAFAGESMVNRKYLFFADVARKLGLNDLAKLLKKRLPNKQSTPLPTFV